MSSSEWPRSTPPSMWTWFDASWFDASTNDLLLEHTDLLFQSEWLAPRGTL
jgi:hypothetical protein